MKKFVPIVVFIFTFFISNAQSRKVRVGLVFSNAISFMKSDNTDIEPTNAAYAFDYGLTTDINFSENYALGTGFIVSHPRAGRTNSPTVVGFAQNPLNSDFGVDVGDKEVYRFTYLDLPTTFKLKTNEIGYFRYFGEFGVVNSFRVRARIQIKDSEFENESIVKENALGVRSNFYNASLKVGGGFEYTISDKTALLVGLYFYNGFVNILDDADDQRTVLRRVSLRTGVLF